MKEIGAHRLDEILSRARARRVVIYGDVMLDEFVWGDVTRISPEAPVPVVEIKRESVRLGGAANVLANVTGLGGAGALIGIRGRDRAGEILEAELNKIKEANQLVIDDARPTTVKTRIIAHNQLVVRADRESRLTASAEVEDEIIRRLETELQDAHAFVVSDYDKGAVTSRVLKRVLSFARERNIPTLIDPKMRNFEFYKPATLVTPNHHEALRFTNTSDAEDTGIVRAAQMIKEQLDCEAVLVTRGERGMMLLENNEPRFVETQAREVYDVTGAGDTVIATLAIAIAAGASLQEAAALANRAAGIVVGKIGTATVSREELMKDEG